MTPLRNVFACLVHEARACVFDLVRNLHALDPASTILLYNGGRDEQLLAGVAWERYGAVICPQPEPVSWGRLHPFALRCMRFALENLPCDVLTIVDSDQLGVQPGYSSYLTAHLRGQSRVGLLNNAPQLQPSSSSNAPVRSAWREVDLWRPFLRRFRDGEKKWVYWSFWPSTVFTAAAAHDLVHLFEGDKQLNELMNRTEICATEEILLTTMVALLGYEIALNPCNHDYVRFRVHFPAEFVAAALERPEVFWIHPVPRSPNDPARRKIRERIP